MALTDNEIIKAKSMLKKLEEAYEAYYNTSKGMPYDIDVTLRETAICLEKALNEINRQKAEIERLQKHNKEYSFCNLLGNCLVYSKNLKDYNDMRKGLKAEGIKEFAEEAVRDIDTYCEKNIKTKPFVSGVTGMEIAHNLVYKRLKEMVGDV